MAGLDTIKRFDEGGTTGEAAPETIRMQPSKGTGLVDKISMSPTETENILANMQKYIEERQSPMATISNALNRGVATAYGPGALAAYDRQRNLEDQQIMGYQQQMASFRAAQEQARADARRYNEIMSGAGAGGAGAPGIDRGYSTILNDPDIKRRLATAGSNAERLKIIDEASKKEFENRSHSRYDAAFNKQEKYFWPGIGNVDLSPADLAALEPEVQAKIKQATLEKFGVLPKGASLAGVAAGAPQVQPELGKAAALAKSLGIPLVSGDRDTAKQAQLYQASLQPGYKGNPVARPGHSQHEKGNAIDVPSNITKEMKQNLIDAGFYQPLPDKDPNHWELIGARGPNPTPKPVQVASNAPVQMPTQQPPAAAPAPITAAPAQQAPQAAAPKPAAPAAPAPGAAPAQAGAAPAPAAPAPMPAPKVTPASQISPAVGAAPVPVTAAPAQQAPKPAAPAPAAPAPMPAAAPAAPAPRPAAPTSAPDFADLPKPDSRNFRSQSDYEGALKAWEQNIALRKSQKEESSKQNMASLKEEADKFLARTNPTAIEERAGDNDYLKQMITRWGGNDNVVGILNKPGWGNAIVTALQHGIQTPVGSLSMPDIVEVIQKAAPGATKEEIEATKEITRLLGQRIFKVVQQSKGSSSDKDWAAFKQIAGTADNGWDALYKIQRYDQAAINADRKERELFQKTWNGTGFDYGKHSVNPERQGILREFGQEMAKINQSHYAPTKTPDRPTWIPPNAQDVMYRPPKEGKPGAWRWKGANGQIMTREAQ